MAHIGLNKGKQNSNTPGYPWRDRIVTPGDPEA